MRKVFEKVAGKNEEKEARMVAVEDDRTVFLLKEARACGCCSTMALLMVNRAGRTRCVPCDRASETVSEGIAA